MSKITPIQLMQMARELKRRQNAGEEAARLDALAQQGLTEEQQEQIHSVMQDKEALQKLLTSPKAQALMKKLGGGK
ncbi:MAG: hypothetical protein LBC83_04300 [Oscillospiraceae bacterium]|jgi:hypothetical protein|nr:hypothetical protein [Oscillospiraceae bacterium]